MKHMTDQTKERFFIRTPAEIREELVTMREEVTAAKERLDRLHITAETVVTLSPEENDTRYLLPKIFAAMEETEAQVNRKRERFALLCEELQDALYLFGAEGSRERA